MARIRKNGPGPDFDDDPNEAPAFEGDETPQDDAPLPPVDDAKPARALPSEGHRVAFPQGPMGHDEREKLHDAVAERHRAKK